jgi:type I restriction-modification system DNA methylase subunit
MKQLNFIEYLDFERAINIHDIPESITNLQKDTVCFVKDKEFGIDKILFCDDFPAVFTKQVISFDNITLKEITKIHQKIWNFKKVLFLYVYNEVEIRIYNCAEKPFTVTPDTDYQKELDKLELYSAKSGDKQKLETINRLFSSMAIDTGLIWSLEETYELRKKINLKHRVNEYLVESLLRLTHDLIDDGLDIGLIHKNILRSLFLLYLEDRGATDKAFYNKIMEGARSYFDILDDVEATYALFRKLKTNFNGNVFTFDDDEVKFDHTALTKIKKCFIAGYENTYQLEFFEDWRLFNFGIIPIELLSEIYENFLLKIDPEKKKISGTFFTPPSLVELMLNERLPIENQETDYNIKILDPACGSGIFLVEGYRRLIKRYEYKHNEKLTEYDKLQKLLLNNIYGIEYDPLSIKVAAFSLYLALLENVEPKTLWQDRKLPYLINNPEDKSIEKQGKNLYKRDTIAENGEIESIPFDLVIGNPPFGTKNPLETIRKYCKTEGFALESALPFLHKSVKFSPKGKIALIFNTKTLTNTKSTYETFRKWLFKKCYVEKIYNFSILRKAPKDFGGQLFRSTTAPISIIFYQKEKPINFNDRIIYYAPKTFIKGHVLEGIVIEKSDVKYLPREECQKPDTKIWKIAMWGGMKDWDLINKMYSTNFSTIDDFTRQNNIKSGVGFQLLTNNRDNRKYSDELYQFPYLDARLMNKYYTSSDKLKDIKYSIKRKEAINFYKKFYKVNQISQITKLSYFRRLGDEKAYCSPHIVVKKGLENNGICASLIEKDCSFRDGVYGFYTNCKNKDFLEVLIAYFNSNISSYYLFMTISSYGIEREQIMKQEFLSLPINLSNEQISRIVKNLKQIIDTKKTNNFLGNDFENKKYRNNIESIIKESLNLTSEDMILISDAINIKLDLFKNKENSRAFYHIDNIQDYVLKLCDELNDYLQGQTLFANATMYSINKYSPLMLLKLSFDKEKKELIQSEENVNNELKNLDKYLWENKATNIYFRKRMNYKDGKYVYLIRPNQRRFWTQSMAMEDASELILEILNEA